MPVFHKDGLTILYVHVPKTGGTSVELFFESNGFKTEYLDRSGGQDSLNRVRLCSPQHMHSTMLTQLFDLSKFDYAFMTVRNPLTRIKSEYQMRRHQNQAGPDFNAWIGRVLSAYADHPFILDNHIRPQVEFRTAGCRIIRQEDLRDQSWIDDISTALAIPLRPEKLGTHMTFPAEQGRPAEEPDNVRLAMLNTFYEGDFAAFGYDSLQM